MTALEFVKVAFNEEKMRSAVSRMTTEKVNKGFGKLETGLYDGDLLSRIKGDKLSNVLSVNHALSQEHGKRTLDTLREMMPKKEKPKRVLDTLREMISKKGKPK